MKKWAVLLGILIVTMPLAWADEPVAVEDPAQQRVQAMRLEMETERRKERELLSLQMEVDRLKLELEKKKASLELGKLSGNSGGTERSDAPSAVQLKYVLITSGSKEAVVDVDGVEHKVREGALLAGNTVKSIADDGVILTTWDGQESFWGTGK